MHLMYEAVGGYSTIHFDAAVCVCLCVFATAQIKRTSTKRKRWNRVISIEIIRLVDMCFISIISRKLTRPPAFIDVSAQT